MSGMLLEPDKGAEWREWLPELWRVSLLIFAVSVGAVFAEGAEGLAEPL